MSFSQGGFDPAWGKAQPSVLPDPWFSILGAFPGGSRSLAVGLFDVDGSTVYANPGMTDLLWPEGQVVQGLDRFMMPTFAEMVAASDALITGESDAAPRLLRTGWIQVGSLTEFGRSLFGQIWRSADQILVIAEYDVYQLLQVEQEINLLNGQMAALQRELTVKNRKLERTLAELQETQAMLIHSEKMNAMGHLVAGMAHEINNPVAFIASNLHGMHGAMEDLMAAFEQMETVALDSEIVDRAEVVAALRDNFAIDYAITDIQEALTASISGLVRVKKLVENLRTFSRLDEAEYKPTDLRQCLESTLAVIASELRNRIQVTLDLPDLPLIPCFAAQLGQVFMNLFLNAIQAIDGPGTIRVSAQEVGPEVVLTFTDSGSGIPADVLPKIFNPFFTTKPVGSGTGLGLYISYKIITEQHQGRIEAVSEKGQGATFILTLPKEPIR